MTAPADIIDKLVLMLVSGIAEPAAEKACIDKLDLTPTAAAQAIAEARRRITIAEIVRLRRQIGPHE